MLRVKDEVDLKELEKFGFYQSNEHMNSWDYELKIKEPERENNFSENGFATLTVREYDIDGKTKTNRELLLMTNTDDEVWYELNGIIYDLIMAGIVEKGE